MVEYYTAVKKETKALPIPIWKDLQSILLSEEEEDVEQDTHSALCAIKGKIRSYINICRYGGRGGQCNGWEQSGRKIYSGMIFFQHFYFEPFEFVTYFKTYVQTNTNKTKFSVEFYGRKLVSRYQSVPLVPRSSELSP